MFASNATPRPWIYTPPHQGKHGKKWLGAIGTQAASAQVCWINNPADAALILRAVNNFEKAKAALERIVEGRGAYNINPLQHCANCLEEGKAIAKAVLAQMEGK